MVTLYFLSTSIEFVREMYDNSYVRKFEVQLIHIYNSTIVRKYIKNAANYKVAATVWFEKIKVILKVKRYIHLEETAVHRKFSHSKQIDRGLIHLLKKLIRRDDLTVYETL